MELPALTHATDALGIVAVALCALHSGVGVAAAVVSLWILAGRHQQRLDAIRRSGATASGRVLARTRRESEDDRSVSVELVIEVTAAGRAPWRTTLYGSESELTALEGDRVQLRYDPADPTLVTLDTAAS